MIIIIRIKQQTYTYNRLDQSLRGVMQQQSVPQLNYYSRFSRKKRTNNHLNSSFYTSASKLNSSTHRTPSNPKRRSSPSSSPLNHNQQYILIPTQSPITIHHNFQPSLHPHQNNQQSPSSQHHSFGFQNPVPAFSTQEQSVSNQIGDVSIPLQVMKYNLNQSDYYITNRLFQSGDDSVSSIQQGESLFLEAVGGRDRSDGGREDSISQNQMNSNTTEDGEHRLIVFNTYKSYHQIDGKVVDEYPPQNKVVAKKNFKSLFKKSGSKEKKKEKEKEKEFVKDVHTQQFQAPVSQFVEADSGLVNVPFRLEASNSRHSLNQLRAVTDPKDSLSQKGGQGILYSSPLKDDKRDKGSRGDSGEKRSRDLSFSSSLTLEDKLEKIYQLNFNTPKKVPEKFTLSSGDRRSNDKQQNASKQHSKSIGVPQVIEFVETNFDSRPDEVALNIERSPIEESYYTPVSTKIDKIVEPFEKSNNKHKQSLDLIYDDEFEELHPQKYSHSIRQIESLLDFANTLQQSKRNSYSPLLWKLHSNTLKAQSEYNRQRKDKAETLQQLSLMLELNSQSLSWKGHLNRMCSTNDPSQLQIINNTVIIESLVRQLSEKVGGEFQLGGVNY